MVEKYDVVENRETGENAWRIMSGNYKGIIFNFKNIKFPIHAEDGNIIDPERAAQIPLRFNFDILSNPTEYDSEELAINNEFSIVLGDILLNELEEALDRDALKFNYENRNNNTEQSTLQ